MALLDRLGLQGKIKGNNIKQLHIRRRLNVKLLTVKPTLRVIANAGKT